MATDSNSSKNVLSVTNILNKIHEQTVEKLAEDVKPKIKQNINQQKKRQCTEPRGLPKSGRPWKTPKEKFSTIKKTIYRRTVQKKEELRRELEHIKELSKSIKANRKDENEQKRLRREENAKRKLENERRSEVVQIIKNPNKLKRMKKKALRKIEKRDIDAIKAKSKVIPMET